MLTQIKIGMMEQNNSCLESADKLVLSSWGSSHLTLYAAEEA